MLIKQQNLASFLARNPFAAIYILIGQDHFLLSESAKTIRQGWQEKNNDSEETVIHITQPADWALVEEKANSYGLFAESLLLDIRYEKQTLDAASKQFLSNYSSNSNPASLVLVRAPNLTAKQFANLANDQHIHLVQIFSLDGIAMQNWIKEQLQKKGIKFDPHVPALIHQYTQGNMLACAQALEKIALITDDSLLTEAITKTQLIDQCDYQLFELSEACLQRNTDKVIQHLRHACQSGTEPTLILWLLAQEIRNLIRLIELTNQAMPFATACNHLKIWSTRSKLYQTALKHIRKELLLHLLQFCKKVDERIKSNQSSQVWFALENIALSLSLGKEVGTLA